MAENPRDLQAFFAAQKRTFDRCLHDALDCENKAIRAHSIQNARVLDLIQTDGHVLMPRHRIDKARNASIEFAKIGRNEASTFTGLCSEHDTELFKVIDTEPLDLDSGKHLTLLAYRSVMREMHINLEASERLYSIHENWVKSGAVPKDAATTALALSTGFDEKAWRAYRYRRKHFDRPAEDGEPAELEHLIITMADQAPVVAAAAFFSTGRTDEGDIIGPTLNVVPLDEKNSVAVLSWPKEQAEAVSASLSKLHEAEGNDLKYQLSKLIIQRVENFVLSPAHYAKWSADKQKLILSGYRRSFEKPEEDVEDHDDLMLF